MSNEVPYGEAHAYDVLGLDATSVEALAELLYNRVHYRIVAEATGYDPFSIWKFEWIPALEDMLDAIVSERSLSLEDIAEICYNRINCDPGTRDLFHYWKYQWSPAIEEVIEALYAQQKLSVYRKTVLA